LIQWRPRKSRASDDLYGEGKSLVITAPDWPVKGAAQPIPADKVVPADLSDWHYRAERGFVGVDPELGRIAFPPGQLPKQGVGVSYHYAFSADIGGGEYQRTLIQPSPEDVSRFQPKDLLDPVGLITRLQPEAEPLVKYLRSRFS